MRYQRSSGILAPMGARISIEKTQSWVIYHTYLLREYSKASTGEPIRKQKLFGSCNFNLVLHFFLKNKSLQTCLVLQFPQEQESSIQTCLVSQYFFLQKKRLQTGSTGRFSQGTSLETCLVLLVPHEKSPQTCLVLLVPQEKSLRTCFV